MWQSLPSQPHPASRPNKAQPKVTEGRWNWYSQLPPWCDTDRGYWSCFFIFNRQSISIIRIQCSESDYKIRCSTQYTFIIAFKYTLGHTNIDIHSHTRTGSGTLYLCPATDYFHPTYQNVNSEPYIPLITPKFFLIAQKVYDDCRVAMRMPSLPSLRDEVRRSR